MRDIVIIYGGYTPNYNWGAQPSSHVTTGKKKAHHFSGSEEKEMVSFGNKLAIISRFITLYQRC